MKKRQSYAVGVVSQKGKSTVKYTTSSKGAAIAVKTGQKHNTYKPYNIALVW